MDIEANKDVVRRYIELWNTGNLALVDEVLAPGYVDHAHPEVVGTEGVRQNVQKIRAADPTFQITIESILSEGDQVALVGVIRMTRQGQMVTTRVAWFVRIEAGKMVELWTYYDRAG